MSGGGGGVIILHAAANHPKATADEKATLLDIADRNPICCGFWDARKAASIIRKILQRA